VKIQCQADADFNHTIIQALQRREPASEFRTADEAQIRGLPDPEVLAATAREGRILVSHVTTRCRRILLISLPHSKAPASFCSPKTYPSESLSKNS
jgi:hypothetical protein